MGRLQKERWGNYAVARAAGTRLRLKYPSLAWISTELKRGKGGGDSFEIEIIYTIVQNIHTRGVARAAGTRLRLK